MTEKAFVTYPGISILVTSSMEYPEQNDAKKHVVLQSKPRIEQDIFLCDCKFSTSSDTMKCNANTNKTGIFYS